jgi:hypothetical protein
MSGPSSIERGSSTRSTAQDRHVQDRGLHTNPAVSEFHKDDTVAIKLPLLRMATELGGGAVAATLKRGDLLKLNEPHPSGGGNVYYAVVLKASDGKAVGRVGVVRTDWIELASENLDRGTDQRGTSNPSLNAEPLIQGTTPEERVPVSGARVSDFPILLKNPETIIPLLNTRTVLHIGGIWGDIRSGQTVLASDGARFVWSADSMTVIYFRSGKFYAQTARGFAGEVRTAPMPLAAQRAVFGAHVEEVLVRLLMGIVAGSSGYGFAVVIGSEVAEFVIENRKNFETWMRQLRTVLQVRDFLKKFAPTLYTKVFDAILSQLYKDMKGKVPDSIAPEVVAFGVGVVLGGVGKKFLQGKLSILAVAFVIVEQIVVRFSLSVVPGAFKLTAEEYKKLADEIIKKMRENGISIDNADVQKIVEEVNAHPEKIKQAFKMLDEVFGRQRR